MLVNIENITSLYNFIQLLQEQNIWQEENLHHYLIVDTLGKTHLILPNKNNCLDNESWFFCRSMQEPSRLDRIIYIKAKDIVTIPLSQRPSQLVLNRSLTKIFRTMFSLQMIHVNATSAQKFEFIGQIYPEPLLVGGMTVYSDSDEYLWLHQCIIQLKRGPNQATLLPGYLMVNSAFNAVLRLYYHYLHENNLLKSHRESIEPVINIAKDYFTQVTFLHSDEVSQRNNDNKISELKNKRNVMYDYESKLKNWSSVVFSYLRDIIFYTALVKIVLVWNTATPILSLAISTSAFFSLGAFLLTQTYQYYLTKEIEKTDAEIKKLTTTKGNIINGMAKVEYEVQIKDFRNYFASYDEELRLEQEARQKLVLQSSAPVVAPVIQLAPQANKAKGKNCLIM